jgi:thiol-disulfide isomerase/thioredoxin
MLGSGKSSGMVNEATNLKANENLTAAIDEMSTKAYQKQRDMTDVIPTHRVAQPAMRADKTPVYDPVAEKIAEKIARATDETGNVLVDDEDDDDLLFLRQRRMEAMKKTADKSVEWRMKQHGSYREIGQDDFFNIVVREKGGSEDVAVHFYHQDFERCKVIDRYLQDLAPSLLHIKLVKIDAEKAPFLVQRLRVATLPCILLFHNDVNVDRIVGYEGCCAEGEMLDVEMLKLRIEQGLKLTEESY